jgi:peptidyl-prolyl cis-trans isomerase C
LLRQTILIRELFSSKKNPVGMRRPRPSTTSSSRKPPVRIPRAAYLVEKEDEAKGLIAQIKGGAKFDELAKKHSKDPGSGANGGDLDFANRPTPEFGQAPS